MVSICDICQSQQAIFGYRESCKSCKFCRFPYEDEDDEVDEVL